MLDQALLDVVHQLIAGTKKGTITWAPESDEGDVFRADLGPGGVRISQGVAFIVGSRPLLIDFLDASGRTLSQHRAEGSRDSPPMQELFRLVRSQALAVDETMSRILAEIKRRSG